MQTVVVTAFYIWLALSVAIVLARIARFTAARRGRRRRATVVPAGSSAAAMASQTKGIGSSTSSAGAGSKPAPLSDRIKAAGAVPSAAAPSPTTPSPATPSPAEAAAAEAAATAEERRSAEDRRRVADRRAGDRRAQPASSAPSTERAPVAPTIALAQLLAGIIVPAELQPTVPDGAIPDASSVSFITDRLEPHEVGTAIADELERLGYELMPVADTEMVARRGDDLVSVRIELEPHRVESGGIRRFPTAKEGDVVLALWVGAGPPPS